MDRGNRFRIIAYIIIATFLLSGLGGAAGALMFQTPIEESDGPWYRTENSEYRVVWEKATPSPTVTNTPEPTSTSTPEPPTATSEPTATSTPTSLYSIVFSTVNTRANPQPLQGATVSGKVYAFVPHDSFMDAVEFFLDGDLVRIEANSPYDFGGGSSGAADSWNTTSVANGEHTISALIHFDDHSTEQIAATFTVNNAAPTPTPTATATPDPSSTPTETPMPSATPTATTEPTATATEPPPTGSLELIPTFRAISVYVDAPVSDLEYREAGASTWTAGHPLWVDGDEARGSIVDLEPDTEYEVRVGDVTATVRTRSELIPGSDGPTINVSTAAELQAALDVANPGDTIRLAPGNYVGPFTLTRDGTAQNYLTIIGEPGAVLTGNAGAVRNLFTLDNADYVRISGLTLRDADYNLLVLLNGSDHAVIEDNQFVEPAFGHDTDLSDVAAAIHFRDQSGWAVIRDNTFHRETAMTSKHSFPALFTWKAGQGLIITGNTVTGGFEDAFRWGPEDSTTDSKSRDIDIYDNVIDGACFDDGIQPEGVAVNVRIWGNRITHCFVSIALAPSIEGPVYVFRNIITDNAHPLRGGSGVFKFGDEDDGRRGPKYIYHNTFVANAPVGEVTVYKQSNSGLGNVIARNNIAIGSKYIAEMGCDLTCDMDYDAVWTTDSSRFIEYRSQKFWSLGDWCAAYQNGCNSIAYDARTDLDANYAPSGQLIDAGVFVPGFSDGYLGNAPDIGAVEGG